MKQITITFFGLILYLGTTSMVQAQDSGAVIAQLQEYQSKMENSLTINKDEYLSFDCIVEITPRSENSNLNSKEKTRLIKSEKSSALFSESMVVLQDNRHSVSVDHFQKVIMITRKFIDERRESLTSQMQAIQGNLSDYYSTASLRNIEGGLIRISAVANELAIQEGKISHVDYTIDPTTGFIRSVAVHYTQESDIALMITRFEKPIVSKVPPSDFVNDPLSYIMIKNKLKSTYSEYELIDLR